MSNYPICDRLCIIVDERQPDDRNACNENQDEQKSHDKDRDPRAHGADPSPHHNSFDVSQSIIASQEFMQARHRHHRMMHNARKRNVTTS
ncbi:hypothetical protein D3273_26985 [Lichenibacterium minor]|uniref:Uncharacterized protein n=1 Tax=Lichenibacterium minor TaxID=2316528 RepID=A0A4V1RTU5_9HYPH|nr:hypothetical protein D3273_26985 [Lichenibacterium minor]